MLSWVCGQLDYAVNSLGDVEFGNRKTSAWSGRAWCYGGKHDRILVRVGGADLFPASAYTHGDGFCIGVIASPIEALIKVTAHEVSHCEQSQRSVKSRRSYATHGNTAGSERNTDMYAGRVLKAFRAARATLLERWSVADASTKHKPSVVEKRATSAFALEQKWAAKMKRAKAALKRAKKKADYYRRNYPDGVYPEPPTTRTAATPKPATILKRKISKYITAELDAHDLRNCKLHVKVFGDDFVLTRPTDSIPSGDWWDGDDIEMREARGQAALGDVLEVRGYSRRDEQYWGDADIRIPATEAELDEYLRKNAV